MPYRRILLSLTLGLLLSACGSSVPQLPMLPPDGVILAFGDSITHGTGAGRDEAWPAVLESRTGYRVINAGVPGEETAGGRQRLSGALEEHRPDLLILTLGGNDMLRQRDHAGIADNLRAMLDMARQRGVPVVMLATPEPRLTMSIPDFYTEIAAEANVPLERRILRYVLRRNQYKADPIHPNAEGYRLIAQAVAELLQEAGAIP